MKFLAASYRRFDALNRKSRRSPRGATALLKRVLVNLEPDLEASIEGMGLRLIV